MKIFIECIYNFVNDVQLFPVQYFSVFFGCNFGFKRAIIIRKLGMPTLIQENKWVLQNSDISQQRLQLKLLLTVKYFA